MAIKWCLTLPVGTLGEPGGVDKGGGGSGSSGVGTVLIKL